MHITSPQFCTPLPKKELIKPQGSTGASLVDQMVKNLPAMQETWVQSLGWEDPLEKGYDYPLQYSCLENFMDKGASCATVSPKSWT